MDLYREELLEEYKNPKNFGRLKDYDIRVFEVNTLCGDNIELFLKFSNEKVIDVSFRSLSCAISTASASLLTSAIKGKTIFEILKFKENDILNFLKPASISRSRLKCAFLPLVAIKKAISSYQKKNKTFKK